MAIVVAIIKFKLLYKSSLNLMEAAVGFLSQMSRLFQLKKYLTEGCIDLIIYSMLIGRFDSLN